jgi:hypothetical protein
MKLLTLREKQECLEVEFEQAVETADEKVNFRYRHLKPKYSMGRNVQSKIIKESGFI